MVTETGNQRKHDPHELEGVKNRESKAARFPWLRVSFFVLACGAVAVALGPLPEKIWRHLKSVKKEHKVTKPGDEEKDPVKAVSPKIVPQRTTNQNPRRLLFLRITLLDPAVMSGRCPRDSSLKPK